MNPLATALDNPWQAMDALVDGPLHPGGEAATESLLDRAGVDTETTLLDVGCGAGNALALAQERGATAVGLDSDPGTDRAVQAGMTALPVRSDSVDVVLGECVLCLAPSLSAALSESGRVLGPGGRLAVSDVVASDTPDLPGTIAGPLCLTDRRSEAGLVAEIEAAGFSVEKRRRHREDLLAMRDDLASTVDYEGLLGALGERGQRLLAGIERLEQAVEDGDVGYVSLVATVD
jgi:SAM-dependent methyltransferase